MEGEFWKEGDGLLGNAWQREVKLFKDERSFEFAL